MFPNAFILLVGVDNVAFMLSCPCHDGASGDRVQVREKQAIKHVERAAPRIGEMGGMLANPGGSSRITVP